MATADPDPNIDSITDVDKLELPEEREYDVEEHAKLDDALESAIEAAEEAEELSLARRLKCELGSHYYEQKFGL